MQGRTTPPWNLRSRAFPVESQHDARDVAALAHRMTMACGLCLASVVLGLNSRCFNFEIGSINLESFLDDVQPLYPDVQASMRRYRSL